jgi:heme exporter protein A
LVSAAAPPEKHKTGLGIRLERIERRFGALLALRSVSLEILPGEFVALLGHNGAGKTTLLRIVAQLMRPSRGSLRFSSNQGDEMRADSVRSNTGLVSHSLLLYEDLTAEENLRLFANLYALTDASPRIASALEACGLASRAHSEVRTFSRGMRQRLAIARALLHAPRLLLLDEPAAGLDRQGLGWLGGTLERLRGDGCTVLMSTHARNESLELATRAILLNAGKVERDTGSGGDARPLLESLRAEA